MNDHPLFELTAAPIDIGHYKMLLHHKSCGACVNFEGWVRNHNDNKQVNYLIYEAFEVLAKQEGARIISQALTTFDIERAYAIHRIGKLDIGDLAVWVGVSSAHRGSAFEACRFIIDALKQHVPIWKHEFYFDGNSTWLENPPAHTP